ncbi:MAG: hypothetical protein MUC87_06200 [Bacteroidia bacterium]|jgi:hypothetical protein|nr:hypothetical protein [Bacteroidia bacterium]
MRRCIYTLLLVFLHTLLGAQTGPRVEANAALQRNTIRIGEQIQLRLSVRYREGSQKTTVTWPALKDTLCRGIEIIKTDSLHTDLRDRTSVLYEQWRNVTITSFEEGQWIIPAMTFMVDNKPFATPPLILTVTTVAVDTTQDIKDIKDILETPPPILKEKKENSMWWWIAGGALVIIASGIILWLINRKKPAPQPKPEMITPGLEPHERVLQELIALGQRKMWEEKGELKNYHTRLTEILRSWVAERYRMGALEMTTGEILQHLRYKYADETAILLLRDVLLMADTVKFAKNIPVPEDNVRSLNTAMEFVRKTPFPAPQFVPPQTPPQP